MAKSACPVSAVAWCLGLDFEPLLAAPAFLCFGPKAFLCASLVLQICGIQGSDLWDTDEARRRDECRRARSGISEPA